MAELATLQPEERRLSAERAGLEAQASPILSRIRQFETDRAEPDRRAELLIRQAQALPQVTRSGTPAFDRATAFHEAGHAVAYEQFGAEVLSISCIPNGDHEGHCNVLMRGVQLWRNLCPIPRRYSRQAQHVIIAQLAGPAAEAHFTGKPVCALPGALGDYTDAHELGRQLSPDDPKKVKAILAKAEHAAARLVREHWRYITDLANKRIEYGSVRP